MGGATLGNPPPPRWDFSRCTRARRAHFRPARRRSAVPAELRSLTGVRTSLRGTLRCLQLVGSRSADDSASAAASVLHGRFARMTRRRAFVSRRTTRRAPLAKCELPILRTSAVARAIFAAGVVALAAAVEVGATINSARTMPTVPSRGTRENPTLGTTYYRRRTQRKRRTRAAQTCGTKSLQLSGALGGARFERATSCFRRYGETTPSTATMQSAPSVLMP